MLVFPLYNIWEHQNIFNILMLLVGIKRELGPENGSAISIFLIKKFHRANEKDVILAIDCQSRSHRGRAGGPSLQFLNQTRLNSFIFKHQGYCFLRVFRNKTDKKFHGFYCLYYNFWTIYGDFTYFLTT